MKIIKGARQANLSSRIKHKWTLLANQRSEWGGGFLPCILPCILCRISWYRLIFKVPLYFIVAFPQFVRSTWQFFFFFYWVPTLKMAFLFREWDKVRLSSFPLFLPLCCLLVSFSVIYAMYSLVTLRFLLLSPCHFFPHPPLSWILLVSEEGYLALCSCPWLGKIMDCYLYAGCRLQNCLALFIFLFPQITLKKTKNFLVKSITHVSFFSPIDLF